MRALASFLVAATAVPTKNATPGDLDEYVARDADVELSELALTIIKYRKVVLSEDRGVRKLGRATPVEENVLFGSARTPRHSPRRPWQRSWLAASALRTILSVTPIGDAHSSRFLGDAAARLAVPSPQIPCSLSAPARPHLGGWVLQFGARKRRKRTGYSSRNSTVGGPGSKPAAVPRSIKPRTAFLPFSP
jgi:hypothetical protein